MARPDDQPVELVEQPVELVEQGAAPVEQPVGTGSEVSDTVEAGSAVLRSALQPKRSPTTIPRYPGELNRTELDRTEQSSTGTLPGSTDAERLLNTLNRGGAVTTTEYNTLEQLNREQLAELNLIRMPNGSIGRITHLQGGGMNFQPLEVETQEMRSWAQKIAEQVINNQEIT